MKTNQFPGATLLLTFAAIALFAAMTFGQEFRGSITGTVTDPNGATVPGATVTIKNNDTNVTTTVRSNVDGAYTFTSLSPGTYTILANATGFKTTTRENVLI